MSPQLRGMHFKAPQQQRGAIGLMAALTLGMVLLFMLLVVDSGRLYFEQRKLQRVADMAALEAVTRGGSCSAGTATTYVNASATRNNFTPGGTQKISPTCGTLVTGTDNLRTFKADANQSSAIRVIATTTVHTSVAGGLWNLLTKQGIDLDTKLTASAVAAKSGPTLAQISIRTTLASVSSAQSLLLNPIFSSLLGGDVSISAVGWEGLAKANINLLQYLNQLAINLDVTAGDYTKLLNTNAKVTQLIQAAATVAKANGATLDLQTNLTKLQIPAIDKFPIKVGDLLKPQTGTTSAGLDTNVNLLSLIQAAIQIANSKNTAAVSIPLDVLGLAKITTKIKIIEPPQFSAIGNPELAKANPLGPNKIYVRTAQVRTFIAVELPILNTITSLLKNVGDLLKPLTTLLNNLLCGLLTSCDSLDINILPPPLLLSVNLDAGGANAYVSDYNCPTSGTGKSLTVEVNTALADLNVGKIDATTVFSSTSPVTATPFPIVDIGSNHCVPLSGCTRTAFGGGGLALMVSTSIAKTPTQLIYSAATNTTPPDLKQPPMPKYATPTKDVVASLGNTLKDISLLLYGPANSSGLLNALMTGLTSTINTTLSLITNTVLPLVTNILSTLLDPLINNLLSLLGINLMNTEVDANLSCNQGGRAQLVL